MKPPICLDRHGNHWCVLPRGHTAKHSDGLRTRWGKATATHLTVVTDAPVEDTA